MPLLPEKSQQIFRRKQPGIQVRHPEMVKETGGRSSACTWPAALGGTVTMNQAKKIFLLPCAGCAHAIEVVAGQAGGRVECPSCHRQTDVPTFRELNRLPLKNPVVTGPRSKGRTPQRVALAGLAFALLSSGAALLLGSPPKGALDHEAIRASIHDSSDTELYEALDGYRNADVARYTYPAEMSLLRQTFYMKNLSRTLYALSGLGVLVAAISGLSMLASPKDP